MKRMREPEDTCSTCLSAAPTVTQRECLHCTLCVDCAFRIMAQPCDRRRCPLCRVPMLLPLSPDADNASPVTQHDVSTALSFARALGTTNSEMVRALGSVLSFASDGSVRDVLSVAEGCGVNMPLFLSTAWAVSARAASVQWRMVLARYAFDYTKMTCQADRRRILEVVCLCLEEYTGNTLVRI